MSTRKDLPNPNAPNFLQRVREEIHALLGKTGSLRDRALTIEDAIGAGLVGVGPGGSLIPGAAADESTAPDLTPPPPPTGVTAITSGNSILVTINPQTYRQGRGPGSVLVFGAKYMSGDPLPVFADAAVLDEFPGDVHAFTVDPAALYRIWVKSVSRDGVPSEPAGGTNGIEPTPGLLDDVSIANLVASRIRSGSVTVGQFIQNANYLPAVNGWRINGDGTAEFSGVVARGAIFASQGAIGGWTIGSNYLQSTTYVLGTSGTRFNSDGTGQIGGITVGSNFLQTFNYSAGSAGWRMNADGSVEFSSGTFRGNVSGGQFTTGAYTGYAWPPAGQYGTYLGPSGLLIGNFNNNKYLQVTRDGNIYAPGFSIVNGTMTINQANVINTLNIAGNAITAPASAELFSNYVRGVIPNGTIVDILGVNVDAGGAPTFVSCVFNLGLSSSGGSTSIAHIRVNGSIVKTIAGPGSFTLNHTFSGGGNNNITLAHVGDINSSMAAGATLFALGVKR